MKKIRFLIFPIILSIAVCFNGDLYQIYLENFADSKFWKTNMVLPYGEENNHMIKEVLECANDNRVKFFAVIREYEYDNRTTISIYCSSKTVSDLLQDDSYVLQGKNRSLFFGQTDVRFHSYHNLPQSNDSVDYYMIGKKTDIINFKAKLVDRYYGSFPKEPTDMLKSTRNNILSIWFVVTVIFLLLTAYEVMYKKKEYAFRMTQGESRLMLYLGNVGTDIFLLAVETIIVCFVFSKLTGSVYYMLSVKRIFPILVTLDGFVFADLFFATPKDVYKSRATARRVLSFSYFLNGIATVLIVTAISVNVSVVVEAFQFYRQKDDIQRFGNLFNYHLAYLISESNSAKTDVANDFAAHQDFVQAKKLLWQDCYSSGYPLALYAIGDEEGRDVLVSTFGTKSYIKEKIPSINKRQFKENSIVYLVPKGSLECSQSELKNKLFTSIHLALGIDYNNNLHYQIIEYDGSPKIIGFNDESYGGTRIYKKPIIIFLNYKEYFPKNELLENPEDFWGSIESEYLYEMSPIEMKTILENYKHKNYQVLVNGRNVQENYFYYWSLLRHSMIISIILSVVLIFLELSLTATIIRLEFVDNGVLIALKKIYGYSEFERYRKIFLITGITSVAGMVIALSLNCKLRLTGVLPILSGGIIVAFFEFFYLLLIVRKNEKRCLVQILKGGAY